MAKISVMDTIRNVPVLSSSSSSKEVETNIEEQENGLHLTLAEQRQTIRQIDLRVCVVLGFINCISHMDRSTLANAAVAGMTEDLQLYVDKRYNIAALIFFVPYLVFEFPGTVLVRPLGSRPLLMSVCMLWGIVTIGTGFVNDWTQLAGLRAVLGFLESSYAPVVMYLLSSWYTRYEVQKRYALYFVVTIVMSSFGSFLAYGFIQMEGVGGLRGWRWSFIMSGILTVLGGAIAGFLVVDFPDRAHLAFGFLSNRQIEWVMHRLREDRGDADAEPFAWHKFLRAGLHLPVWLFAVIFCCCTTVLYSVGFFLPTILHKDMGFSTGAALCMTVPPYIFSAAMMFASGWIGDRYHIRGLILVVNSFVAIIGLVLLGWTKPSGVRYFSIFIINGGLLANIPAAMAYQANNIRGQWVRAFGSAAFFVGGGLGGIFGSLIFGDGDVSSCVRGILGCIGLNVLVIVVVMGLTAYFHCQNRLAKKGLKLIHGHPGFLYSL